MPSSLLYMSEEAREDATLDGDAMADLINKWTAILGNGEHALEWALNKERGLNHNPIIFLVDSHIVPLAHSLEFMALDDDGNEANKKVGFFIGN
jgi:hypothetical protein